MDFMDYAVYTYRADLLFDMENVAYFHPERQKVQNCKWMLGGLRGNPLATYPFPPLPEQTLLEYLLSRNAVRESYGDFQIIGAL